MNSYAQKGHSPLDKMDFNNYYLILDMHSSMEGTIFNELDLIYFDFSDPKKSNDVYLKIHIIISSYLKEYNVDTTFILDYPKQVPFVDSYLTKIVLNQNMEKGPIYAGSHTIYKLQLAGQLYSTESKTLNSLYEGLIELSKK